MTDLDKLLQEAEAAILKVAQQQAEQLHREAIFAEESQRRFSENKTAFEKYYPEIAKTIHEYKPRANFKILVTKSGYADFVPEKEQIPLYGESPMEIVGEQVDKNLAKGSYSLTTYGFGGESKDPRIHMRYMHALDRVLAELKGKDSATISALPAHFPSAIIFGVGLGYHIPRILQKHSFDYLFICEPDLELFYASLFCIDWKKIIEDIDESGNTLFLQVGVTYEQFFSSIFSIATDIGAFSLVRSFCYQHYPSKEVNLMIKEFFERYFELQSGFGFYNDAITGLAHALINLDRGYPIYIGKNDFKATYQNIPVFVVGNGPSLDAAEEILHHYKDDVIIIAAGTALASLLKMGITPDFHVLVERTKTTYDVLMDTLPKDVYAGLNLLTVDVMYPDVMDLYKWAGFGLKGPEASSVLIQCLCFLQKKQLVPSMPNCGPMVSNLALSYAMTMGFKDIYLIGVNNGAIAQNTHSKYSIYNDKELKYKTPMSSGAKYKLEGNLGVDVMATSLLSISKKMMDSIVTVFSKNNKQFVYNVGHGAKIKNTYPLSEDNVMPEKRVFNKSDIIEKIKSDFFKHDLVSFEESQLEFDLFDEICDHLISIGNEPFESRKDASDLLKRQSRYLYAFRQSRYMHLFHMLKGSMLYYHSPMITMLYQYEDDYLTLKYFRDALELWNNYILEIKEDYRKSWQTKCGAGSDFYNLKG